MSVSASPSIIEGEVDDDRAGEGVLGDVCDFLMMGRVKTLQSLFPTPKLSKLSERLDTRAS